MKRLFVMEGQRFGRLTVVSIEKKKGSPLAWKCVCDCGSQRVVLSRCLVAGMTKSCGCLRREVTGAKRRTHGQSESRTYRIWNHMRRRCHDPKNQRWVYYGGRGITVCERWSSFANFLADMGHAPDGMSIDRIDSNGSYEPGNCRWATQTEQTRNMSRNILVSLDGRTQCLSAWCEELGVRYALAYNRVHKLGWEPIRALQTPKGGGA